MIDDLQREINKIMDEQNNRSIPEFEGYSPVEMTKILYYPFENNCPVKLMPLVTRDYEQIPMIKQILYLANFIQNKGQIKLTQKGFLPTKIVYDLCSQEFLMNERIENANPKNSKESDSMSATITRIIMELSRLVKKRNNKLSLTKAGEKILSDYKSLLERIIKVYCTKFNWAYFDGFGDNHIGQLGFGFSLILISKYGNQKRLDEFYADKYFKAFPQLVAEPPPTRFGHILDNPERCYSLRTFDRFMDYFGLVKIEQERWDAEKYVYKTDFLDKLIKCEPPKG